MGAVIYVAQECAFVPGIVKEWPAVIKHPKDCHGRLVKVEVSEYLIKLIEKKRKGKRQK